MANPGTRINGASAGTLVSGIRFAELAPRSALRSVNTPPSPAGGVPLHGPARIARPDGRAWMGWNPSPAYGRRI